MLEVLDCCRYTLYYTPDSEMPLNWERNTYTQFVSSSKFVLSNQYPKQPIWPADIQCCHIEWTWLVMNRLFRLGWILHHLSATTGRCCKSKVKSFCSNQGRIWSAIWPTSIWEFSKSVTKEIKCQWGSRTSTKKRVGSITRLYIISVWQYLSILEILIFELSFFRGVTQKLCESQGALNMIIVLWATTLLLHRKTLTKQELILPISRYL